MRFQIYFILAVAALLSSCSNFENIEIGNPRNITMQGFEDNFLKIKVELPVKNPTLHRIQLLELDVKVFLNNQYIGKLIVDEEITIKGKRQSVLALPVKIRLSNILNTAFIMMSLKKGNEAEIRFVGNVIARSALIKRTVQIDESRKIVI